MSMIRSAKYALIAISVMAFQSVSHAETPDIAGQKIAIVESTKVAQQEAKIVLPKDTIQEQSAITKVNLKEIQCLAKNIFYESASEPEEGKIAVGVATLNRTGDRRFSSTVCGVINQRSSGRYKGNCQFSWRCSNVKPPKATDQRWVKCQEIASNLLTQPSVYEALTKKYANVLYFHATFVRPLWARQKVQVARVGNQMFYKDRKITYI